MLASDFAYNIVSYLPIVDRYNIHISCPLSSMCRSLYLDVTDEEIVNAILNVTDDACLIHIIKDLARSIKKKHATVVVLSIHFRRHTMHNVFARYMTCFGWSEPFSRDMFNHQHMFRFGENILSYVRLLNNMTLPYLKTYIADNLISLTTGLIIREYCKTPEDKDEIANTLIRMVSQDYGSRALILLIGRCIYDGNINVIIKRDGHTSSLPSLLAHESSGQQWKYIISKCQDIDYNLAGTDGVSALDVLFSLERVDTIIDLSVKPLDIIKQCLKTKSFKLLDKFKRIFLDADRWEAVQYCHVNCNEQQYLELCDIFRMVPGYNFL